MCGICGVLNLNYPRVDLGMLKRMTDVLAHRGPDGEGVYAKGRIGLGHRRLAIIDLSENARQPMLNEDGSIAIVFNGMIYNYKEHVENLKKKGHIFKSQSDTEVIIHLYEEFGIDCVRLLRGMFAFAIWDAHKEELIIARDRIGQKPLVYAENGDFFLFASEPKAILVSAVFKPEVNPAAFHYLFSYMSIPYPYTMFKGIYKLPPASIMVIKEGKQRIEKYWNVDFTNKAEMDIKEAIINLEDLIDESVRLRLLSDIPVSVFLSGGVDSSIISLFCKRNTTKPLKAFSLCFEKRKGQDLDCLYARRLATKHNMEHQEINIDEDIIDEIERVVWHYDEPFPVPVALAHMKFCREVKKEFSVALGGEGGDEIFAGYTSYYLWKIFGDLDIFLKKSNLTRKALFLFSVIERIFGKDIIKFILLPSEEKRPYIKGRSANSIAHLFYSNSFKEQTKEIDVGAPIREVYSDNKSAHLLDATLFTDLILNNNHGTCVFSDISGMANGIELRSPFLDHKIVEFAARLPVWMKINGLSRKYILKRIAQSFFSKKFFSRRKWGYGETIPFLVWFSQNWRKKIEEDLFNAEWNKNGFIKTDSLKSAWKDHCSGRKNNFRVLWSLYCYSIWHRVFIREFDNWSVKARYG